MGYTYVVGQEITRQHALASVALPDGSHTFFDYDANGRLIEVSGDGGAEAVTISYLSPGGYKLSDATARA